MVRWFRYYWKSSITIVGVMLVICCYLGLRFCIFGERQEQITETGTANLSQYDSKYTYMEDNGDGTYDLYIYASAIQWKDGDMYRKIDNSIIPSEKEGYVYENASNAIKTYFPLDGSQQFLIESDGEQIRFSIPQVNSSATKTTYVNLYGDKKEAICYEIAEGINLYMYPIYTGFHIEYVFEDGKQEKINSEVIMDLYEMNVGDASGEYVVFNQKEKQTVIVYAPMMYLDESQQLYFDASWSATKKDEKVFLEYDNLREINEEKVHVEFSVQIHGEDMPDTTVYENKEQNVYLSNRAIVGDNNILGKGWHYVRYRINYFFEIDPNVVISAEYHTKNLNYREQAPNIKLYSPKDQWSSTQMIWDTRTEYVTLEQNETCNYDEKGGVTIGLTKYVTQAIYDSTWMTESIGSIMTCVNGYAVLATSDNGEYIPCLIISLEKLPEKIIKRSSINESM